MSGRTMHDEAGFTLVELLLVCALMIVVLGATLTTLSSFQSNAAQNERQNDAQDEARRAIDTLARELRNLASPVNYDPDAVKRAAANDLIVQSVAPVRPEGSLNTRNTQYVRYCYEATTRLIHRQVLTWTTEAAPAVPTGTSCPAGGWESTQVVANHVVNDATDPIFTYNGTTLETITEIHTALEVDYDPATRPRETTIETTVFLRNQNRVPIARFSADPTANGAILLNGSASEDPEERALTYHWYDADVSMTEPIDGGEGIVFTYTPPGPGLRRVFLIVKDPADLESQAPVKSVCVPGGTTC